MAKKYRFPYLAEHTDGAFKYQRAIPHSLRTLIGKAVFTEYIGHKTETEAGAHCLAVGATHTALFRKLRALSPADRHVVVRNGGIGSSLSLVQVLDGVDQLTARLPLATPHEIARFQPGRDLGEIAIEQLHGQKVYAAWRDNADASRRVLIEIAPVLSEYSWEKLFENWKRKVGAKRTEQHARTLRLLTEILGEMDYRRVTAHDIDSFLRALAARSLSLPAQIKQRERVSGMFRAAVPLKISFNPCKGVTVDGKHKKTPFQPFSGEQERAILAAAESKRHGGKRHAEVLWMLRLQIFMGCRVREASQLQFGDVDTDAGIPVLHFREQCAVTGRKHPEKSIKSDEARTMPLHPALWDKHHPRYVGEDFRAYSHGEARKFIFAAFDYSGDQRGRADWMIQNGGKLLKDAGIEAPKGTYAPNHSFRHRWNDAARNADWPLDFREAFMGQAKGINAKYGGNVLIKMAKMLWDVDPLSDM